MENAESVYTGNLSTSEIFDAPPETFEDDASNDVEAAAEAQVAPEAKASTPSAAAAPVDGAETAPKGVETKPTEQAEVATPQPSGRNLAFKAPDGTAVALNEAAAIEWKVDGKFQPVAVKDLLENYAGKVAWDRKYQELASQRREAAAEVAKFTATQEKHRKMITHMHENASKGNIFAAVQSMIDMSGLGDKVDARQYVKQLREALIQQAQTLTTLTPEQRELYEAREEHEFLKAKHAQVLQSQQEEQAKAAFRQRVDNALTQANASMEEFVSTRDQLRDLLIQQGKDPSTIITPEYVAQQIGEVRNYRAAKEVLDAIDPNLAQNAKIWDSAVAFMRQNPDFTKEDLKEVFGEALSAKRAAAVGQKVATSPVATTASASARTTAPAKGRKARLTDYSNFSEADVDW